MEFKLKPRVMDLGSNFYVILYHPTCPRNKVENRIHLINMICLRDERRCLIREHVNGLTYLHCSQSPSTLRCEQIAEQRELDAKIMYQYSSYGMDGALDQVKCVEE